MARGSREPGMASFPESRVGNQFSRSDVTTVPSEGDEGAPVLESAHAATAGTVGGTRGIDGHDGWSPSDFTDQVVLRMCAAAHIAGTIKRAAEPTRIQFGLQYTF